MIIEKLRSDLEALDLLTKRRREHAMNYYKPYGKQQEFHDMGIEFRERLLRAGNRCGKTFCASMECAYHLTGEYPDWWLGRRWDRPVSAWAAGTTGLAVRDIIQTALLGEAGVVAAQGTGAIPKDNIVDVSLARGVDALVDSIQVKHKSGGVSIIRLKTYEQGREKWQGTGLDFIWFDEEPPSPIFNEGLTRIGDKNGMVFLTFTPLLGKSDVLMRFLGESSPDRGVVQMTVKDALHLTPEMIRAMTSGYAAYEREARLSGAPLLGSGRVFPLPAEMITEVRPAVLPEHWAYLWSIDFGINHPFAAVLNAWDKDADCIHVVHTIRMKDARPIDHAAAMKPIMPGCPVAWPQDGTARESGGETIASQYKKHGLKMLPHHATFADGGLSTEAGIMEMFERMTTNRYKVAGHLNDWFEEFGDYHRKDGLLVKERDDLMSASRVGVMMKRFAKQQVAFVPGGEYMRKQNPKMAQGLDDDPWKTYE